MRRWSNTAAWILTTLFVLAVGASAYSWSLVGWLDQVWPGLVFEHHSTFIATLQRDVAEVLVVRPSLCGIGLALLSTIAAARLMLTASLNRGGRDQIERLRRFVSRHRWQSWCIAAVAVLATILINADRHGWDFESVPLWSWRLQIASSVLAFSVLFRACWGLLVAPLRPVRCVLPSDEQSEKLQFSAAAVTREAKLGVVAVMGIVALSSIAAARADLSQLRWDTPFIAVGMALYSLAIALCIAAFQRASRISLGLDGILIHGTSRRRFFGYHDLDTAESTRWGEILLRRGDSVILRLQPHGEDAARRDELAARIQTAIDHSRSLATGKARLLAETASIAVLRGVARGGDGYRSTGVGRDELWQLIEAPVASSDHRRAAAEALAAGMTGDERLRLRVAAEHCADPAARTALLRIAAEEADAATDGDGASASASETEAEVADAADGPRRDPAHLPAARLGA